MGSARNVSSAEMLEYILDTSDLVTEEMLMDIVRECNHLDEDDDVVQKILTRGDTIRCDKDCILEAFLRESSCGQEVKHVLNRYVPRDSISQDTVKWVIENETFRSAKMLPAVLDYWRGVGVEIEFNQELLVPAASQYSSLSLFWSILGYAPDIVITKKLMKQIAAGQSRHDHCLMINIFMDHADCGANSFRGVPTWDITNTVNSHIRTCTTRVSEDMVEAAMRWEPEAIEYLQTHARPNVRFVESLREAELPGLDRK